MWTPQLAPAAFPWEAIRAQYPAAYAALFDTSGGLSLYNRGAEPHQFELRREVPEGETAEYAQAAHPQDMVAFAREFALRDLYIFFDGYGIHAVVSPQMLALSALPGPPQWEYCLKNPGGGFFYQAFGAGYFTRLVAEKTAFTHAFRLLNDRLSTHVEASPSGPAV